MASLTKRATSVALNGKNWHNEVNMFDTDVNSYAYRNFIGTSDSQINGFGFDFSNKMEIESITVATKLYASSSYGYICLYLISDEEVSDDKYIIKQTILDGKSTAALYYTYTFSKNELEACLRARGLYNGDVRVWLNEGFRIKFVCGSTTGTDYCNTRIYDNYVTVNYAEPKPQITDVKITYGSQPVSKLNKVPCGEGFILSVGVGYSNSILG